MEVSKRANALVGGVVVALGVASAFVPLFDIRQDVAAPPYKSLSSTVVENSVPLLLAVGLVAGGAWLATRDWEFRYVANAAKWTVLGAAGFAVAFGWVVGVQWGVQDDLKPFVIVLDAAIVGAIAALFVGVYDSDRRRRRAALARERDRLTALFESGGDLTATVRVSGTTCTVRNVNAAFEERFDDPEAALRRVFKGAPELSDEGEFADRVREGDPVETELTIGEGEDRETYLVRVVPYPAGGGNAEAFLVLTDVTERRRLARERAARRTIERLHEVATDMSRAETHEEAYELTMDAAEETLSFDAARLVINGEPVSEREPDDSAGLSVPDDGGLRTEADGGSSLHADEEGMLLTASVGVRGRLQARAEAFDEEAVTAAELLTTHLRETLDRLDREAALREDRERLEFLNRVLRHDLLNGMNVIRMQAQLLERHVDESDETGRDRVETVIDQVDDMSDRLETIRSFTKAVVEEDDQKLEPVALNEALTDQIESLRAAHEVDIDVAGGSIPPVKVRADDLLAEAFHNLLTNAVEHHGPGTPVIRIEATTEGEEAVVRIGDDGPGIPESLGDRAFEKGEKGEDSEGTGLGLYLVQEIVEAYGGNVDLGTSDLGGAAFTVRLPRAE